MAHRSTSFRSSSFIAKHYDQKRNADEFLNIRPNRSGTMSKFFKVGMSGLNGDVVQETQVITGNWGVLGEGDSVKQATHTRTQDVLQVTILADSDHGAVHNLDGPYPAPEEVRPIERSFLNYEYAKWIKPDEQRETTKRLIKDMCCEAGSSDSPIDTSPFAYSVPTLDPVSTENTYDLSPPSTTTSTTTTCSSTVEVESEHEGSLGIVQELKQRKRLEASRRAHSRKLEISQAPLADLDRVFFRYLTHVCSNADVIDKNGEWIHQPLMAKKMQCLEESPDFRTFKFRIWAFTNGFMEELEKQGIPVDALLQRQIKYYLRSNAYISRFNEDGRKTKAKGNHVWNIDAKETSDGGWVFRPFRTKISGSFLGVAYLGLEWQFRPFVWDPHESRSNREVVFSSPNLPAWLRWNGNVLSGTPTVYTKSTDLVVQAKFTQGETEILLSQKYFLVVESPSSGCDDQNMYIQQPLLANNWPGGSGTDISQVTVNMLRGSDLDNGRPSVMAEVSGDVLTDKDMVFIGSSMDTSPSELPDVISPESTDKGSNTPHHKMTKEEIEREFVRDVFTRDSEHCLDGRVTRLGQHPVAFGGNADVWEGLLGTQKVAIKTLRPFSSVGKRIEERKLLKRLWREYVTWTRVTHPVVLQCLGFSYDFSPEPYVFPSLISPWLSNGTLPTYLEKCPGADRFGLLTTVAEALSFLHGQQPPIIHGDLRGDNILVSDSGHPCLSDFGHSRIFKLQGMSTTSEVAGTVRWMSPELLFEDIVASESSDVWAYGMTVLEIMSGQVPYHDVKGPGAVLTQIIQGRTPLRPQDSSRLTDEIWIICQRCWRTPCDQRPRMQAVYLGAISISNVSK